MSEIASAWVSLLPSTAGFGKKLDSQIGGDVDKTGKKAGLSFGKIFAGAAALGIGAKTFSFIGDSLGEAREAEAIGNRTANVITKMGNAAGISAKGVGDLAGAISNKVGMDDEAIQSGANMLLTFGKIRNEAGKGNDIFSQTTRLMTDMSAAMGSDTKSSALQLGKALNDPIKGVSALSRVGVSFTEQQKAQIKTLVESGKTMGAQKVILEEVKKQFGGAAAAMASPADKAKVAFGNLKEQIGTALLPAVDALTTMFTTKIIPAISGFITGMQNGSGIGGQFASALGTVKANLGTIAPALGVVVAGMAAYKVASLAAAAATAIQAAGTAGATGATWSLNAALRANPIGLVVTGLTALGVGLVVAYKKSETFRKVVDNLWGAIKVAGTWVAKIAGQLAGVLVSAFSTVSGMTKTFIGALSALGSAIVSRVQDVGQFVTGLKAKFGEAVEFVKGLPEKITGALGNAGTMLLDTGKNIISGLVNGIRSMAGTLVATIKSYVLDKIPGPIKKFLGIASPSKVMHGIGQNIGRGLVNGIGAMSSKVGKAAEKMGQKVLDKLKNKLGDLKQQFATVRDGIVSALMPSDLFSGSLADLSAGLGSWGNTVASIGDSVKKLLGQGVGGKFLEQLVSSGNAGLLAEVAASGQGTALAAQFETNMAGVQGIGSAVAGQQFNAAITDVRDEIRALRRDLAANAVDTGHAVGNAINVGAANAQRVKKNQRGKKR